MSTTTGADTALDGLVDLALVAMKTPDTGKRYQTVLHAYADAVIAAGWRPPARVISGDVEAVTAALDGLPVGSIITCDDDGPGEGGLVYHKRQFSQSEPQWYEPGFATRVHARGIARHQVPITVLREGTGA